MIDAACPCLHTHPCSRNCTCVQPTSSQGCSRCCTYGSKLQQVAAAEHLAAAIDGFGEVPDGREPGGEWGFISLDGGKFYVRQSEILGLRWVREDHDHGHDRNPRWTTTWHMEVAVTDVGKIHIYGEDIVNLMTVLGLPTSHPEGGYGCE